MFHKIIILLILFSTPCFSEDGISSYTDENGNTVYYGTNEKKSRARETPRLNVYREHTNQPYSNIQRKESLINNQTESKAANSLVSNEAQVSVSKKIPLPLIQPKFSKSSINSQSIARSFFRSLAFLLIVGFSLFLIWFSALVDILRNEFTNSNKIIWLLSITFLPFIGSVLYLIIGRKQKIVSRSFNKPNAMP